jgi:uncharacterized protein (TIGR03083 family)
MDFRRTYRAAAVSFAQLVSEIPAGRWGSPGLGDWTLRDLVGHTVSSALRQVPEVLGTPAEDLAATSAEAYWGFVRTVPAEVLAAHTDMSAKDARETGAALGDDPGETIRHLIGRATATLAAVGDDDLVATPVGGMRVRDYLPTRTFELAVHGMDIAAAAGLDFAQSPDVLAEAAAQAARIAVTNGDGEALLRALTGRAALPPGFTVVA